MVKIRGLEVVTLTSYLMLVMLEFINSVGKLFVLPSFVMFTTYLVWEVLY